MNRIIRDILKAFGLATLDELDRANRACDFTTRNYNALRAGLNKQNGKLRKRLNTMRLGRHDAERRVLLLERCLLVIQDERTTLRTELDDATTELCEAIAARAFYQATCAEQADMLDAIDNVLDNGVQS